MERPRLAGSPFSFRVHVVTSLLGVPAGIAVRCNRK